MVREGSVELEGAVVRGRLHHVALGARDVERVAAFYRQVFGLREVARHLAPDGAVRSIWLDLGGAVLMIEHSVEAPRAVHGVGAGPFLLAFAAPAESEDELAAALAPWGAHLEARTAHSRYFRDPEGNRVALSDHPLQGIFRR